MGNAQKGPRAAKALMGKNQLPESFWQEPSRGRPLPHGEEAEAGSCPSRQFLQLAQPPPACQQPPSSLHAASRLCSCPCSPGCRCHSRSAPAPSTFCTQNATRGTHLPAAPRLVRPSSAPKQEAVGLRGFSQSCTVSDHQARSQYFKGSEKLGSALPFPAGN